MRTGTLLLIALLAASLPASALAEVKITTTIDSPILREGESFTLSIAVMGALRGIGTPQLPDDLADFALIGTSSSTNFSFVNGVATNQKIFRYTLIPLASGQLEFPAIPIEVKGVLHNSRPIKMQVRPASGGGPDPGGNFQPGDPKDAPSRAPRADNEDRQVFIRSWTDRQEAWVGEQVTHHFGLYRDPRVRFTSSPSYTPPDWTGFWTEALGDEISGYQDINGTSYAVTELRNALFPNESGTLTVGPATVRVRLRGRSAFEFFSFDSGPEKLLRSAPIEIEVKPLPADGRPDDFSGTVARDLRLDVRVDKGPYEVGKPLTLTIALTGKGNPRAFREPGFDPGPDFKVYDPDLKSDTRIDQQLIRVNKEYSRVLVPKVDGTLVLPGARYAWFDAAAGRYRTAKTADLRIEVAPSTAESSQPVVFADLDPERVELLGRSIHHIKTSPLLAEDGKRFPRSSGFWLALGLPWPLLAGAWVWRVRRDRLAADSAGARARGASRIASRRLKQASKAREAGDFDSFCVALASGLRGYLADRLNASAAGLTADVVESGLATAGVADASRDATATLLAEIDFARYAPGSERSTQMDLLIERAGELMDRLEGEIRRGGGRRRLPLSILPLLALALGASVGLARAPADAEVRMAQAADRYEAGDFVAATGIWESLAAEGVQDSHLWYNLGNAYFQQDEIGLAILSYRRALRLAPRDREIRDNLELARSRRLDGPADTSAGPVGRAWNWVRGNLSPGELAAFGLAMLWLGTALVLLLLFRLAAWRKLRPALLAVFVLLPILSIAAWTSEWQDWSGKEAVVLAPAVKVQSGPGEDFVTLFESHEGAECSLEERRGNWVRVSLGEDLDGWIPSASVDQL